MRIADNEIRSGIGTRCSGVAELNDVVRALVV